jgi:alginate export protein
VRPLPATRGGHIDLYYLGIDKKRATFDRGTAQEVRHTAGTRFWGCRSALDYDWEAMFQWGTFGDANIRGRGIGTDTAYNLRSAFLRPQLSVRTTFTSGDRNPPSGALGTLNPLFPTGIYYGEGVVSLNGPSNLMRIGVGIKLHPTDTVLLAADYDPFWRTSLQDGVYGLGVNLLRSGLVNQNRYIGSQASTGIYWQANRHLSISAAYTHFFVGPFSVMALRRDATWITPLFGPRISSDHAGSGGRFAHR